MKPVTAFCHSREVPTHGTVHTYIILLIVKTPYTTDGGFPRYIPVLHTYLSKTDGATEVTLFKLLSYENAYVCTYRTMHLSDSIANGIFFKSLAGPTRRRDGERAGERRASAAPNNSKKK